MNHRFDGIAGPAAQKLTNACNALPPMVQACVTAMTPGHINWAAYRRWFDANGNANRANVQFVRSVFTTVNQWIQTKTFTFANVEGSATDHAIPGLCVYVVDQILPCAMQKTSRSILRRSTTFPNSVTS